MTVTLDSYGRVRADGTPVDPDRYDYRRAARDAVHFSRLLDRFVQNLRRVVGWDVQYFAAVEPQRRLAPHLHLAIRGTVSRVELRQVAAATYHQVWWPQCDQVVYELRASRPGTRTAEATSTRRPASRCRPGTRRSTPARTPNRCTSSASAPRSTRKASSPARPDADRCDRLPHQVPDQVGRRLPQPRRPTGSATTSTGCSTSCAASRAPERCANWLLYGVQPKDSRRRTPARQLPGQGPPAREHLGYGGRRVLVSRKWSGKTLADHRADRRDWVLNLLGNTAEPADPNRYVWELVRTGDPDVRPLARRLLLADRRTHPSGAGARRRRRRGRPRPDRESSATVDSLPPEQE